MAEFRETNQKTIVVIHVGGSEGLHQKLCTCRWKKKMNSAFRR